MSLRVFVLPKEHRDDVSGAARSWHPERSRRMCSAVEGLFIEADETCGGKRFDFVQRGGRTHNFISGRGSARLPRLRQQRMR